jgi:hypothetical protein
VESILAKRSGTLKSERSLQTRRILLGSSACRICDAAKKFRWRRSGPGILLAGKRGGKKTYLSKYGGTTCLDPTVSASALEKKTE